jgi:hypothetical protein
LILMSAISNIDVCYSDIGRKYVGLEAAIPVVPIMTSEFDPISDIKTYLLIYAGIEPEPTEFKGKCITSQLLC